ncbi:SMI1/KNR4 family protein [Corynebacterium sp. USCH3]
MKNSTGSTGVRFSHRGQACDDNRVLEIESALGRHLPQSYRTILTETGCGIVDSSNSFIPFPDSRRDSEDGVEDGISIDQIWGNGTASNGAENNIDQVVPFLSGEWGLPEEVLLFATSEAGMHECIVINYELTDHPRGSILLLDTEQGGEITTLADSFDDLVDIIVRNRNDSRQDDVRDSSALTPVDGAETGPLSDELTRMIHLSPVSDAEALVRTAASRKVSQPAPYLIENDEYSRTLLDMFMWLLSEQREVRDVRDFRNSAGDSDIPSFRTMITESFGTGPGYIGFSYSKFFLTTWWDDRVDKGFLLDTGHGYRFREEYMNSLFNTMRAAS